MWPSIYNYWNSANYCIGVHFIQLASYDISMDLHNKYGKHGFTINKLQNEGHQKKPTLN